MAHEMTPSVNRLPAMPERPFRPSEDHPRTSEDTEHKRLLRDSYQSTATVRTAAPTEPSIMERPSIEVSHANAGAARQQAQSQLTSGPMTQWQPVGDESQDIARVSHDQRPPGLGAYGRATSNDYTVYGGVDTPTPAAPPGTSGNPHNAAIPFNAHESYFQRPYRRAPTSNSIRDPAETASIKASRYTPLATGHAVKKSRSMMPGGPRAHFPDGYEAGSDVGMGNEVESTPPKRPAQRKRTSVYLVREGGGGGGGNGPGNYYSDGSGGSIPPEEALRLPFFPGLKGTLRNHLVAFLGEFVGTTMFLFFAFAGTVVANVGAEESNDSTTNAKVGFSPIVNLYVAVSFGFSLMVNVWIFFRVSGGLFNPAVTLGMVMTKTIGYVRGLLLVAAQLVGAILASFLVQVLFPSDFNVRTTLAENTNVVRGLFIEAILTAELVFTVFMLAKEKHKATYMAPIGIGLALFVAELVGVFFTGGSLNPARSFGPEVVSGQFGSDHWIYWVGPAIGTIAAYCFYRMIKILEYEMANPGQDHDEVDEEVTKQRQRHESGSAEKQDV